MQRDLSALGRNPGSQSQVNPPFVFVQRWLGPHGLFGHSSMSGRRRGDRGRGGVWWTDERTHTFTAHDLLVLNHRAHAAGTAALEGPGGVHARHSSGARRPFTAFVHVYAHAPVQAVSRPAHALPVTAGRAVNAEAGLLTRIVGFVCKSNHNTIKMCQ